MTITTILCWGGWLLVLFFVNPYEASWIIFLFFYSSLFLALSGLFSIMGFIVRFIFIKNQFAYQQAGRAWRQGLLLAATIVVVLFLASQKLLVWWNLCLLFFLVFAIEYFFTVTGHKIDDEDKGITN